MFINPFNQSLNNILMGHKAASLNSRFVVLSAGEYNSSS
ncbi:hypothetical protein UUU_00780 [Klebsiella pneumoniae subsp. pneumoniae DSM 30104 = JCM 1662 = NBRC 14940]|nr:hypothetical protein UUU_00780 [Klebsiella pneumoniae subsp. pneumoniae DSM 30104 = JCM 1662 = NBRC 14940]